MVAWAYSPVGATKFTRITARAAVCTGKPCIRDLRFPVSRLLGLLAARQMPEQILAAYPYLEAADIEGARRPRARVPPYRVLASGRTTKRCEKSESTAQASVIPKASITTKLRQSMKL